MTALILSGLIQLLPIVLIILKQYFQIQDEKTKKVNDENKTIDSASNADDIMRESGEIRQL